MIRMRLKKIMGTEELADEEIVALTLARRESNSEKPDVKTRILCYRGIENFYDNSGW